MKEGHYLDLVGDPAWPTDKLRDKITQIRTQREKITIELGALDSDLDTGRDIFITALTLMSNPQIALPDLHHCTAQDSQQRDLHQA